MTADFKDDLQSPARLGWVPWVLLLSVMVFTAGLLAHEVTDQRDAIESAEQGRLEGQAALLNAYLGERLSEAVRVLRNGSERADSQQRKSPEQLPTHLASIEDVVAGVRNLTLVDSRGAIRAQARRRPAGTDVQRDQALQRLVQLGRPGVLVVMPPLGPGVSGADDGGSMLLALATFDTAGRLNGAAMAVLDPACCQFVLDAMKDVPDAFASIAHGDGAAFLFSPERPDLLGRNLDVPGSFFRRHREGRERLPDNPTVSVIDGMNQALLVEQRAVLRTLAYPGLEIDRPPVVLVGRKTDRILAVWRRDVLHDVVLFALLTIFALGSVLYFRWRERIERQRQARVMAERHDSDQRFQLAVEGAQLGIWEVRRGRLDEFLIDAGTARVLGRPQTRLQTVADLRAAVIPEDYVVLEALLAPPPGPQTVDAGTMRVLDEEGHLRVLRVRSRRLSAGPGEGLRVIGTLQDVTLQARASARIEASEARLKAVFDVLPVGITVTDVHGNVVDCNSASETLLGISREQHLARAYDGRESTVRHPDGRIMTRADYPSVRAFRDRKPVHEVEMRVEIPGGERWLSVSAIPVFEGQADRPEDERSVIGVVTAYIDVAASRRMEAELRKLTRALDQSVAAVLISDDQGRIEYANAQAVSAYGYSREELLGQTPRIFKSGQTPAEVYRKLWAEIRAGRPWRGELVNRCKGGSLIHELVSISPVRDAQGRVTHFVAVREDLTERIANERLRDDLRQRIARVERMEVLGAMAGGVAHEFNNILVGVLGFSGLGKLALTAAGGPPKVISYFEEIEIAGQRARRLVQQLQSFSQGGAVKPERLDLVEAANDAIALLRASFPESLRIVTEFEPGLPAVEIDPIQLSRLFANSLRNARDAMNGEGEALVVMRRASITEPVSCDSCHEPFSGDYVMISVADRGCGVPEHLRGRIFEPFYTTWRVADGAGMGLAVVHGVLHSCGGHVRVLTRSGGGTEFQIFLRLAPATSIASGDMGGAEDAPDKP